ncbi:hypothetical protein [Helicobacter sp.]|uniref:hypothetical protein n=1 Tax=Helicobacter sp. TaxID=218 RepID=UPI0025BE7E3A|nr:hypothetical protein [Helicobacter sp.]MBR2494556.1 hypothetical protein [Helicobacter sp.]
MASKSGERGINVEIFCESGKKIGLGHLYRCIKLARICAQVQAISTITLHNRGDFIPELSKILPNDLQARIHYNAHEWFSSNAHKSSKSSNTPVLAIIDSYLASMALYAHIQECSDALICLDDTLRDIYPAQSYILNPSPESCAYFATKPYHLWCGEQYAIMPQVRERELSHRVSSLQTSLQAKHILVSFGGVDSKNLTQALLQELHAYLESSPYTLYFHIVLGGGYTHKLYSPLLQAHNKHHRHIAIYRNLSPDIFLSLAQACDYAISAGGGSMLELLGLKIPSIILESASNQRTQIAHFKEIGAIKQAKGIQNSLNILTSLLENASQTQAIQIVLESLQLGDALEAALRDLAESLLFSTLKPLAPI